MNNMPQIIALIRRKANSLIRKMKKPYYYIIGMSTVNTIAKEMPENTLIIILTNLLGDSIYGLAYIDEVKKKYPGYKITVIGAKKYAYFLKNYVGIDELVFTDDMVSATRKRITSMICSSSVSERALKYGIYNVTTCFYDVCYNAINPDSLYQLKTHILKLSDNAQITYPKFDDVCVSAIDNFERDKDKIVIINPYSNSLAGVGLKLFERIATILQERGYRVFTNTIGEQSALKGTERLDCKIDELFSICKQIPLFISVRSGVLDAIVSSDVNIFVVYDQVDDKWMKIFSVKSWKCTGLIEEVQLNNIENVLTVFSRFMNEVEVS
jgi:hypothetical protein